MNFVRTKRFKADFKRLPRHIQRSAEKAFRLLVANPRYPSLRTKKMEGEQDADGRDLWEGRITKSYRFTFAIMTDAYIFYRIGPHDIERRPR